ncbi:MAG TPA: hypothetical protein VD968_17880 [Pyrinomonadaceae bacterium]|nr:hypothetical protein [Pyrinomonadaceae bacterium]
MLAALALAALGAPRGQAASGDLDPSFGTAGKVITVISNGDDELNAVAVQPDGKIIVAGTATTGVTQTDFTLARYNPNGTLDTAFGGDGIVTTDFFNSFDYARALAIQPDGKIVVAGYADLPSSECCFSYDFALARYNSDGTLDTTFDGDGKLTTDFFGDQDYAVALAIQPDDGKIVAAGSAREIVGFNTASRSYFALARYNPDGSLDSSFNLDGKATVSNSFPFGVGGYLTCVAIQPDDGKIVAGGQVLQFDVHDVMPERWTDFALLRFNPDGSPDPGFGTFGQVTTDFSNSSDNAYDLALQSDGKVVMAGSSYNGGRAKFALVRYNPDGSLDSSFGAGGKVATDFGVPGVAVGIAIIQLDGVEKIVVSGSEILARYNVDGTLDTDFNGDGSVIPAFAARHLAIQPDGRMVTAGLVRQTGTRDDFALARYLDGAAAADLSITKAASKNPAAVNQIFNYSITVSNEGPDAATQVVVTDTLPAGPSFVSAEASQGACLFSSGTVTCQLGTLAGGATASVIIKIKPRAEGTLTNTATVSAAEPDPDTSDNSSTVVTAVVKYADLSLKMTDSKDPVVLGEQFSYTLTVTNAGPAAAGGVTLTDTLPAAMTFVSASASQGGITSSPPAGSSGTVTAALGTLGSGATATVQITVTATQAGAFTNTASVSAIESDPNAANNTAKQATTVVTLSKLLLSASTVVGGCQPYPTGVVYLTGPAPAGGATVSLSSTNAGAAPPPSVTVPAGATQSAPFTVTTSQVSSTQSGSIKATLGAKTVGRSLSVTNGSCQ